MIPFFVADRPMSLRLLKGVPLQDCPGVRIGIMAHANTTQSFQQAFRDYPCDNLAYCDAVSGPCKHRNNVSNCSVRQYILNHTVKMCDSGIFTREGATLTYDELLKVYDRMGVEYGVMIDVFQDPRATLESAKKALQAYESFRNSFKLVGVAHGDSVEEYLDCYARLKQLGFSHIAVGGLLRRRKNTVRFPYVRSQELMFEVLRELRQRYPKDWLFALGCLHPSRVPTLKELDVWADYKGWIFQYEKRNETLNAHLALFASNDLKHLDSQEARKHVPTVQEIIARRSNAVAEQSDLSLKLLAGRRTLRASLSSMHHELQREAPEIAARFGELATHGLLDDTEERLVGEALQRLGKQGSEEANRILENIHANRELKSRLTSAEEEINQVNFELARGINILATADVQLSAETRHLCNTIVGLIEKTEREHRFGQVRDKITKEILALL